VYTVQANKHYNNWTFGIGAWIYFEDSNSNPYFVEECAISQPEGSATYSDKDGNLLFYSDGMTVWNKNHIPITNGRDLIGSPSSFQACYIFPVTGQSKKLYIITIGSTERANENIYSSIIDYTNGYDNAEITNKNTLITKYNGERAAVIKKPTESDKYWMILDDVQKPNYLIYSIDETGINLHSKYAGGLNKRDNHGGIKISKNANMIVSVDSDASFFEICRFDPFNGIIYENRTISSSLLGTTVFSEEFSPNNKFLYVVSNEVKNGKPITIMNQFDIIDYYKNNNVTLNNIVREPFVWKVGSKESIQIGPNDKLYIASPSTNYISSIENPNKEYPACNYVKESVDLKNTEARNGLPSIMVDPVIDYIFVDTLLCVNQDFLLDFNTNNNSFWTKPGGESIIGGKLEIENVAESDSGYYHYYDESNDLKYILLIKLTKNDKTDFIDVIPSNTICRGQITNAVAKDYVKEIIWWDNSNEKTKGLDSAGFYTYKVTLENGCVFEDSVEIRFKNINPQIKVEGKDCNNGYRVLKTYKKYENYIWSTGSDEDSITVTESGKYWVSVKTWDGCIGADTINIEIDTNKKDYNLLPDTLYYCFGEQLNYELENYKEFEDIIWSNGEKGVYVNFDNSGSYRIKVIDKNGCFYFDSTNVVIHNKINFDIFGSETKFCVGDSLLVELNEIKNIDYIWFDGNKNKSRYFSKTGSYTVNAIDTLTGCSADTTFSIDYYPNVVASIELDSEIIPCNNQSIYMKSKYSKDSYIYFWNGEEGGDSIVISETGNYILIVKDKITGCSDTTSRKVEFSESIDASINGTDICEGEKGYLYASPKGNDYDYQWSTGENSDSIEIKKSGEYFVVITKDGCSDTAYFSVDYYKKTDFSIIGDSLICPGNSSVLESSDSFSSYLWSTGDNTKSIEVNKPGIYTLVVVNENGCSEEKQIEVKYINMDYEISSKIIDFGKLYLQEDSIQNVIIKNLDGNDLMIKSFEYGDFRVENNNFYEIEIEFNATDLGVHNDTIWFEVTEPCNSSFYIVTSAKVYTIATISSNKINAKIGDSISVPFYIKGSSKIGNLTVDIETEIANKLFIPFKGLDFNSNIDVSPYEQNIYNINGQTLISNITKTPVDYVSVTSDNEFVEFELIPGSIEVDSICIFDFRNVSIFSDLKSKYKVFDDNLNIKIEQSSQNDFHIYTVELFSITGKKIYFESIESQLKTINKNIPLSLVNTGAYILRVSNQYQSKSQKILITK